MFIKYRTTSGIWKHANLSNDAGHFAPSGSIVKTGLVSRALTYDAATNPGVGAFIYRSANNTGTFTATNVQLQWNYGLSVEDNDVVDIQVFCHRDGVCSRGSFAVGDGLSNNNQFILTTINTASANTPPSGSGSLGGQAGGYPTGQTAPSNAKFPNGFNDFYCMKYEISQQGYVDFLNTLTRQQQINRVETDISVGTTAITYRYVMVNGQSSPYRNSIRCDAIIPSSAPVTFYCDYDGDGIGGEIDDGKDIACAYLLNNDLEAYLDWSGLRPITEMEYEKSARGNRPPEPGEYAWGNSNRAPMTSLANPGLPSEKPGPSGSNCNCSFSAPSRVGSFAGATTNREQAGAGYYGVMELTGNLYERCIYIQNGATGGFIGSHGNGSLNIGGNCTNSDWPTNLPGAQITFKGGSGVGCYTVSDRVSFAVGTGVGTRDAFFGGQGGRTAPN